MKQPGLLGSRSPRRQELLQRLGLDFRVEKADIDESIPEWVQPAEAAEWLACQKAQALQDLRQPHEWLITADTMVLLDGAMLNKPRDHEEAHSMLFRLSGKTHIVKTGVCVHYDDQVRSFSEETRVHFFPLTGQEIETYVRGHEVLDKAGAYGIQDWLGLVGVSGIDGCFFNVMGLPTPRLVQTMNNTPHGTPQN